MGQEENRFHDQKGALLKCENTKTDKYFDEG